MIKKNIQTKPIIQFSDITIVVYKVSFIRMTNIKDLREYLLIGFFSSLENANKAVYSLLSNVHFQKYKKNNFEIGPCVIDRLNWFDGFITKKYK